MTDERCSKKLWMNYGYHQCFRKAVVCRDGRWYCKKHDPGDPSEARTWWEACALSYRITPVQVMSETPSTVVIKGGLRKRKVGVDSWVQPMFAEAKACLLDYLEREVSKYARRLKRAERNLEAARKLEEPTNDPNNRI